MKKLLFIIAISVQCLNCSELFNRMFDLIKDGRIDELLIMIDNGERLEITEYQALLNDDEASWIAIDIIEYIAKSVGWNDEFESLLIECDRKANASTTSEQKKVDLKSRKRNLEYLKTDPFKLFKRSSKDYLEELKDDTMESLYFSSSIFNTNDLKKKFLAKSNLKKIMSTVREFFGPKRNLATVSQSAGKIETSNITVQTLENKNSSVGGQNTVISSSFMNKQENVQNAGNQILQQVTKQKAPTKSLPVEENVASVLKIDKEDKSDSQPSQPQQSQSQITLPAFKDKIVENPSRAIDDEANAINSTQQLPVKQTQQTASQPQVTEQQQQEESQQVPKQQAEQPSQSQVSAPVSNVYINVSLDPFAHFCKKYKYPVILILMGSIAPFIYKVYSIKKMDRALCNPKSWMNWQSHVMTAQLLTKPHHQVIEELLPEIAYEYTGRRYIGNCHQAIDTFLEVIKKERETIDQFIQQGTRLVNKKIGTFFGIYPDTLENAQEKLKRVIFLENVVNEWVKEKNKELLADLARNNKR